MFGCCENLIPCRQLVDDDFVADHLLIYFYLIVSMTSGCIFRDVS